MLQGRQLSFHKTVKHVELPECHLTCIFVFKMRYLSHASRHYVIGEQLT